MKKIEPVQALRVGDAVTMNFRGRLVDGVITALEHFRRGRRAGMVKYIMAPTDPVWKAKAISLHTTDRSAFTLRKNVPAAAVKAAQKEYTEQREEKQKRQFLRTVERRNALEDKGLVGIGKAVEYAVGDTVVIQGPGYRWDAEIGAINYRTGKVGIVRAPQPGQTYFSKDPNMRILSDALGGLFGTRSRRTREFRWIPATHIVAVKHQERAVPFTLTPEKIAAVKKEGWKQFRFGREFIESSYVVATTAAGARKGQDYEVASKQVFKDPGSGLFWRATGSFD